MKKVVFNPADVAGKMMEAKALAAMYDFSVDVSDRCPEGCMLVMELTETGEWRMYDESRSGRDVPGEQLGAEDA